MTEAPALEVRNISKRFGKVAALQDVNFELRKGEIHALVGENGAGKSTLTRIIVGDYEPDAGSVVFEGEPAALKSPHDALMRGVRLVTQERALAPTLSVAENILLGRLPVRRGVVNWRAARRLALEAMSRIGLELDPDVPVADLAAAAQQEVEICKALIGSARVVMLDEPTAALSETETERLFDVVRQLRDQGVGVIYISHRLGEIQRLADRVTVMRDGRVAAVADARTTPIQDLVRHMVGREVLQSARDTDRVPASTEVVLELDDVSAPGVCTGINLTLRAGEIVALFGVVGSGATEIPYVVAEGGNHTGSVTTVGGIGLVPADRRTEALLPQAPIRRNLGVATLPSYAHGGIFRRRREAAVARRQIEALKIRPADPEAAITALSGGNQQKAIVGRWLQAGAKVLLMCEPTRGVDIGARTEIYDLLRRQCREGMGCLIASTDIEEVTNIADRVYVVAHGRVADVLEGEHVTASRALEAATR